MKLACCSPCPGTNLWFSRALKTARVDWSTPLVEPVTMQPHARGELHIRQCLRPTRTKLPQRHRQSHCAVAGRHSGGFSCSWRSSSRCSNKTSSSAFSRNWRSAWARRFLTRVGMAVQVCCHHQSRGRSWTYCNPLPEARGRHAGSVSALNGPPTTHAARSWSACREHQQTKDTMSRKLRRR